jgi:hypothetical protein
MKRSALVMLAFILAASLSSFAPTAWGSIVVYNTQPPISVSMDTFPVGDQLGNEITLSGTNAELASVQFGVTMQNQHGTVDLRLRVYGIDAVSGKPSNLLYDSNWKNSVAISGLYSMVDFEVSPNVQIPSQIAVSLEQRNASLLAAAVCSDGACAGSCDAGVLWSASGWSKYAVTSPLLMKVNVADPAPEPASITLVGLGLAGLLGRRAKRRP